MHPHSLHGLGTVFFSFYNRSNSLLFYLFISSFLMSVILVQPNVVNQNETMVTVEDAPEFTKF